MDIRDYLMKGKDNALTRYELSNLTGLPDRKVRDLIQQENKKPDVEPIVNLGKGYFIATPNDADEVLAYCKLETSRAREIENKIRVFKSWLARNDKYQLRMEL